MIRTEFRRIAAKENGKFYYGDSDIGVGRGVNSPNVAFIIKFIYKDCEIVIINKTGYNYYGNVIAKFQPTKSALEFSLSTKSHFARLFSRKKERFKIASSDINLTAFLGKSPALSKLSAIAGDTVFEPFMYGNYEDGTYELRTEYHLQFSDWTQVLEPLIAFYKEFIDSFSV